MLVNNAAHQMSIKAIEEISDEEWEKTLSTNISAMFYIVKAAVTHMPDGSSIINTASINADAPSPHLLAYCNDKRSDLELHRRAGPASGGERDQSQRSCSWPSLDSVDSFNDARRGRHTFRRAGSHEATGTAMRACVCLCHARI